MARILTGSSKPGTPFIKKAARNKLFKIASALIIVSSVVLFNILADIVESRYGLRKDYSFNSITTQSDTTNAVLNSLDKHVHIYMLFTKGQEDSALAALIERYTAASSHVTSSIEDITKNPLFLTMISDELDDSTVSGDCVIIRCEETGRTRVLSGQDYLAYTYNNDTGSFDITGLKYEKSITEALVYVTRDEIPALQILSGHGELSESETAFLEKTLVSANYKITRVNLISGDILDPNNLLMILSPLKDLTEGELMRINDFTASGGCLFITSDYSDPTDLPNFNTLYRNYGFVAIAGIVVADKADPASYYSDSPAILLPKMLVSDATGVLITADKDMLVLAGARAFETPYSSNPDLRVQAILQSDESAYIRAYNDAAISLERKESDIGGSFVLSLIADRAMTDGTHSRAFIIGNSNLFLESWMAEYTYSTEFLLQIVQYLQGKPPINLDILPKEAIRPSLSPDSILPASVTLVLLPTLVLIAAMAVLLPRRHL